MQSAPQPSPPPPSEPAAIYLTIVIPCYNEADRIGNTLAQAAAFLAAQPYQSELVLVDDGSRDNTPQLISEFARQATANVRLLAQPQNRGKGHAVRTGVLAGQGEFVLVTDADLPTPLEQVERLLAPLQCGEAQVAVGSRNLGGSEVRRPGIRTLLSHGFNLCVRLAGIRGLRDTQCPFKLFPRDVARAVFPLQRLEGWGFDVEIIRLCQLRGYRIAEVPVDWTYASGSKMKLLRDARRMLRELGRVRLNEWRGLYREAARPTPPPPPASG